MTNILKNWRTSLAGILSIGAGLSMVGHALLASPPVAIPWNQAGAAIVAGVGLLKAADAANSTGGK